MSHYKITPDVLDIALRANDLELSDNILTKICKVVNILNEKKDKATIKDLIDEETH